MTTTDTGIAAATPITATGDKHARDAAQHLFDADCVMHIAKQSHVPAWIDAAHEHLIAADLEYQTALATADGVVLAMITATQTAARPAPTSTAPLKVDR